jgi:hypothetical protein
MRKWIPVTLIALAIFWFILTNVGSSLATSDFAARPLTALSLEGTTIRVQRQGQPASADEARFLGGRGVMFGMAFDLALPNGTRVTCTQRFRTLSCNGGWQAVRGGRTPG